MLLIGAISSGGCGWCDGECNRLIGFTLTDTGAPWTTAAGVLTPDNAGYVAAVHAFACAQPGCSATSGAAVSEFAANSDAPPDKIHEPATLALLGTALVGFSLITRRYTPARVKA